MTPSSRAATAISRSVRALRSASCASAQPSTSAFARSAAVLSRARKSTGPAEPRCAAAWIIWPRLTLVARDSWSTKLGKKLSKASVAAPSAASGSRPASRSAIISSTVTGSSAWALARNVRAAAPRSPSPASRSSRPSCSRRTRSRRSSRNSSISDNSATRSGKSGGTSGSRRPLTQGIVTAPGVDARAAAIASRRSSCRRTFPPELRSRFSSVARSCCRACTRRRACSCAFRMVSPKSC